MRLHPWLYSRGHGSESVASVRIPVANIELAVSVARDAVATCRRAASETDRTTSTQETAGAARASGLGTRTHARAESVDLVVRSRRSSGLPSQAASPDEAERAASVAVLTVGSFEQHGHILPLAADTMVACAIADHVVAAVRVALSQRALLTSPRRGV